MSEKKLRAFSASSRMNSNAVPCRSFVPDLVTAFISAPALRPLSALYELVCRLNSSSASGDGKIDGVLK